MFVLYKIPLFSFANDASDLLFGSLFAVCMFTCSVWSDLVYVAECYIDFFLKRGAKALPHSN
jgi:hypothetical protein